MNQAANVSRAAFLSAACSSLLTACADFHWLTPLTLEFGALVQRFPSMDVAFAENADRRFPAASVVKLLIAAALIEHVPNVTRSPNTYARATHRSFGAANRYFSGALPGSRLRLGALLQHMIEQSDNFSSNVIIDFLGAQSIDGVAAALGLRQTRIQGLFVDTVKPIAPRTFTTARDCNKILAHILTNARGEGSPAIRRSYQDLLRMMERQRDRRIVPSATTLPVADKTGEIHGEINDASIISPSGPHPVLFTILTHGNFNVRKDERAYVAAVHRIQRRAQHIVAASVGVT